MINHKKIRISRANSRKSLSWPVEELTWGQFLDKLKAPVRSQETQEEYFRLSLAEKSELKDVGGFVGGTLRDNRRKNSNVLSRDLVTLDLDNIETGKTQDVLKKVESLGCAYAVYSTRSHSPYKPRLRIIFPTDRTMAVDEYEPIARKMGSLLGMAMCDPTTFEPVRLMFWPSASKDGEYIFCSGGPALLSADGILGMYQDWRNINEWPEVPGTERTHRKLADKQGDPRQKTGVIGAFCRTYDIYQAIETFIPSSYSQTDIQDRLTFNGGSTTGGAIVYDDGLFLFSHHATDPTGGKLVNAFDLIRLHLYGDLDNEAKDGTPVAKMPSFIEMSKRAVADTTVSTLISAEKYTKATEDFNGPVVYTEWFGYLEKNPQTGQYLKTTKNVAILLRYDPALSGRVHKNLFNDYLIGMAPLPWGNRIGESGYFTWLDDDDAGLRMYVEGVLGFRSRDVIDDALRNHAITQGVNPLRDYLQGVHWDGKKRLDTLYIDYFGAEDSPYMRTIARKAFVAAVARVMQPGIKFDYMTVVNGPQGIGKSTFFKYIGLEWFSDSLKTFEGKEAAELLQGVWIIEVGELEAFNKSEINTVKQFLTKTDDQYRAAYARKTEKHPRQCVFFGTTNNHEYLRDTTGNRRFWPVEASVQRPTKSVFRDLEDEVNQIWAEAYAFWTAGETLYLDDKMEAQAEIMRSSHMERDPLQGQIEEFLEKEVPEDWQKWTAERRRLFWMNPDTAGLVLTQRDRICAVEIWKECLNEYKNLPRNEAHRINGILESLSGWERGSVMRFGAGYGSQKGFKPLPQND